ncbi:glycerol-3-phosphate dehydrogenase [Blastomyces gilchristii SLH14081]|uniref:glycerol-3-phosphate dehydrogenase n=1 Tax=Blastomyces gilchristii (strain SLH14081) TaxID=559298 RepID=A0A179US21_BLAGS|nr:glycerol-3-phosphate dehydrogenase [Blastomyces gilchristii SLH14081]OAT10915.1 glycerol-3-phosphate dehydrogenase [Blastomyces gilchristii SLH14081]
MASRFSSRAVLKPLAYTSIFVATGGIAIYTVTSYTSGLGRPGAQTRSRLPSDIPPRFPQIKPRHEQISDLRRSANDKLHLAQRTEPNSHHGGEGKKEDEGIYDLLIIGAGATGAGIALDAATRGLKVALVERDDFSSGTSSKSTKLVHGGVRYLEKAILNLDYNQYKLVKEALHERKYFLDIAPHLSTWLPTLLPIRTWWQAPYLWAGTKMYDLLAGHQGSPEGSYFMTKNRAMGAFPTLNANGMVGALCYYDGQHNDARMNVSLAMTAALYGATVVNHMEVTGLEKDASGMLCGAQVRDTLCDNEDENRVFTVRAKGIINATGPFSDAIQQMDEPTKRNIVAPSSGIHIVLPGWFGPQKFGLIDPSSDGRVIFLLPWGGNLIAGTTDSPCEVEKSPIPRSKDIDWILNEIREQLTPEIDLRRSDVLSAWSGIRPLILDPNSKNTESLVRSHLVTVSKSGLLTCAGGKWTTYREMAEDAVNKAIMEFHLKPQGHRQHPNISGTGADEMAPLLDGSCQTHALPVIGAHGYHKTLYIDLIKRFNLDAEVALHLAHAYGDRAWEVASISASSASSSTPGNTTASTLSPTSHERLSPSYPYLKAEIKYAIKNEYAMTAADFLARRTRLAFLDTNAALQALPGVIDLMGNELKWSRARREREWTETVHFLASMGLPADMMSVTREQVMAGKVAAKIGEDSVVGEWAKQPQKPSPTADGSIKISLSQ